MSNRCWRSGLGFFTTCLVLLWASTVSAIPAGPYFPLPDGATWTYARSSGGTERRTVTGSTMFNGSQVRVVQDDRGSQQYFTNDGSGIRFHGAYSADPVNGGTETDTYVPPVVLAAGDMPIGVPVGSSGTVFAFHTVFGTLVVSYTATSVLTGIDPSVTVPAGTFTNVAHVQTTIAFSFVGGSFYQIEDLWLASGIGVIRETIFDSSGPQTTTFQLLSYNVPDTIPDPFSFTPKTAQSSGTFVVSDPITVSGINAPAPISVSGGEYQVNGGAFTVAPGPVNNGDQVAVRVVSAQPGQSATATLDIGGVAAPFTVTTSADTNPSPFSFTPVMGAPLGVAITSDSVVISDINASAPISIVGGEYSVSSQPFTNAPGTVSPNYPVRVRVISASGYGATTSATLTIGDVSATFSVTTQSPGQGPASVLYYTSQDGDYIGQGEARVLSFGPVSTLTVSRNPANGVSVSMFQGSDWFFLDLAAPGSAALQPGNYEGAVRYPFHGAGAGLSFYGNGRGCNTLTGRFDVLDIAYAPDGSVLSFAANFEQHCEGAVPAVFGEFRFNSTILLGASAKGVRAIAPNPVDLGAAPGSFTITGGGFANAGFGMPVVNFTRNGVLLGQVRATGVAGATLTVPYPTNQNSLSGALPGLSTGAVTVSVYNQTSGGGFGLVGSTTLTVR